jgi:hypothetical protein
MHSLAIDLFGLTPVQIALLISGAALIFGIRRWRRNTVSRISRNTMSSTTSSSRPIDGSRMRDITMEMQALLADLEETSRRLSAQLDNRYTRLEQLLAEADAKIQHLEQLTQGATSPAPEAAPRGPIMAEAVTDAQRALTRLRSERGAPPAEQDPAYQPIYTLADRGKSSRESAQELGRQPGEIELILALRRG